MYLFYIYVCVCVCMYIICVFPILINLKINLPRTVSSHLRTKGIYFKCQANYGHREWDGGESPAPLHITFCICPDNLLGAVLNSLNI